MKRLSVFLLLLATLLAGAVHGELAELIVQDVDLPVAFALANGQPDGADGYAALFFRPEVLAAPELPAGDLLGVMAHLELAADADAAAARFEERRDAGAIRAAMGETAEELLDTRELEPEVAEADAAVLFRVEYELEGVYLIEYRFSLRVANAVAGLVISGRAGAGGAEPAALARQARRIATRQAARLAGSR